MHWQRVTVAPLTSGIKSVHRIHLIIAESARQGLRRQHLLSPLNLARSIGIPSLVACKHVVTIYAKGRMGPTHHRSLGERFAIAE